MNNSPNQPMEKEPRASGFGRLVKALIAVLIILIIVIIILLLRGCGKGGGEGDGGGAVVLEPDYPNMETEANAESIESDASGEKPEVSQGGGSVSISFMDEVTYSVSTGQLSLYYQNPGASTHNVVVQVILVRGEDEYLLSQSGILEPGYQVTSLLADKNAPQLSTGGYDGKLRLLFYDPETGERAIVDTDIPCTISVTE